MTGVSNPPLYDQIADRALQVPPSWTIFFNDLTIGDTGTEWVPTFQNLTEVGGSAEITGVYYQISRSLVYFRISVNPATSTSSVAGTTFVDNFPLAIQGDGPNFSLNPAANVGGAIGVNVANSGRIYTPQWTNITTPVIIVGMVEAQ